jgi:hypothetical protein
MNCTIEWAAIHPASPMEACVASLHFIPACRPLLNLAYTCSVSIRSIEALRAKYLAAHSDEDSDDDDDDDDDDDEDDDDDGSDEVRDEESDDGAAADTANQPPQPQPVTTMAITSTVIAVACSGVADVPAVSTAQSLASSAGASVASHQPIPGGPPLVLLSSTLCPPGAQAVLQPTHPDGMTGHESALASQHQLPAVVKTEPAVDLDVAMEDTPMGLDHRAMKINTTEVEVDAGGSSGPPSSALPSPWPSAVSGPVVSTGVTTTPLNAAGSTKACSKKFGGAVGASASAARAGLGAGAARGGAAVPGAGGLTMPGLTADMYVDLPLVAPSVLENKLHILQQSQQWAGKAGVILKQAEPEKEKCHWDFLLAEMVTCCTARDLTFPLKFLLACLID